MPDEIIQLTAADYDEATDFLSYAFRGEATDWFRKNLATCYYPCDEIMGYSYAIKRDGCIVAMAGAFPSVIHFGDHALKNAGIGGVAVSPDCRGQGLMVRLMSYITEKLRKSDVQLSYLGGMRQRYNYFGWERAGFEQTAQISPACIKHHFKDTPCDITLVPLDDDPQAMKILHSLYHTQPLHVERSIGQFQQILCSWEMTPYVARNAAGQIVGYITCHPERGSINELVADSPDVAGQMLCTHSRNLDKVYDVYLPPVATNFSKYIHSFAENPGLAYGGNWQIFDWPATLTALLNLKSRYVTLAPGRVILYLTDLDKTLELAVASDEAYCTEAAADRPDLEITSLFATHLLTSPLCPSQILSLPESAAILDSWCPLPLGIGRQDKV